MIFRRHIKSDNDSFQINQPKTWKQKFKLSLYRKNYQNLVNYQCQPFIEKQGRDIFNESAHHLIENIRKNYKRIRQKQNPQELMINHQYCVIVPLKKSVQFDDQIINTFLYVRNLKESNNLLEQDNFYTEIRKFLKNCKQNNRTQQGWGICLKRFVVNLDVLTRVDLFNQLQKHGSKHLSTLHKKYSKDTLIDIFAQRVFAVNKYFQQQIRINKTMKISLQVRDKINEANISKTMKMLYCSICLIYDCGKHKLQDLSHNKDHHYLSPKNLIQKSTHIEKAIKLLKQLKDLQANRVQQKDNYCSDDCFKKINKNTYLEVQLHKSRIISPMVQSIIKIGIELFSFSPCLIKVLFPRNTSINSRVTCSIIFLYLIEQVSLLSRLQYKINSNQVDYLLRQCSSLPSNPIHKTNTKNFISYKKKKEKAKKNAVQQFKYQQVAICIHSFIGEDSFDQNCSKCVCFKRGFCLPQCLCGPNCPLLMCGCSCKGKQQCQSVKCLCYKTKNQCIPGICLNCFPSKTNSKKNGCKNDQILRRMAKSIKVGISKIPQAGFGAFAGQKIKKGSLISVYCGEIVDQQMESIRQTIKVGESFYNFACSQGSIDARFMGNKTRFINHANENEGKTNLISLNMFSGGLEYIGLYALRDIQQGEQLLFDYDGEGEVAKNHSQKYSFLKKAKMNLLTEQSQ